MRPGLRGEERITSPPPVAIEPAANLPAAAHVVEEGQRDDLVERLRGGEVLLPVRMRNAPPTGMER